MKLNNIAQFNDLDLYPEPLEGVDNDLCIKNSLLCTKVEGEPYIILHPDHLSDGFNLLSKLGLQLPLAYVDQNSYDRLFHRFLEIKTDKELETGEFVNVKITEAEEYDLFGIIE